MKRPGEKNSGLPSVWYRRQAALLLLILMFHGFVNYGFGIKRGK